MSAVSNGVEAGPGSTTPADAGMSRLVSTSPEAEYLRLDREFFEALVGDANDASLARLRTELRRNHVVMQEAVELQRPRSEATKETERVEALAYQLERTNYRISAKPFLHTARWWEPDYLAWTGHGSGRATSLIGQVGEYPPARRTPGAHEDS